MSSVKSYPSHGPGEAIDDIKSTYWSPSSSVKRQNEVFWSYDFRNETVIRKLVIEFGYCYYIDAVTIFAGPKCDITGATALQKMKINQKNFKCKKTFDIVEGLSRLYRCYMIYFQRNGNSYVAIYEISFYGGNRY